MKQIIFIVLLSTSISLFAQETKTTNKTQAHPGKKIYTDNCMSGCHAHDNNDLFLRTKNKKANDKKGLSQMVSFCVSNLGIEIFPDDEKEIVDYLNQDFYKYE